MLRRFIRILMTLTCLALMQTPALANDPLKDLFKSNSSFLDVDEAFQFSYVQNGEELELYWQIADDYYLYADKFQFSIENATLGDVTKPSGTQIEDEFFGVTNVYFFEAQLNVLVSDITDNAILNVRYQGCAKAGLCYNPVVKKVPLEAIVTANSADMATRLLAAEQTSDDSFEPTDENISEQHKLASLFENQSLWLTLLAFFALGVGLAFTPCVFPMFPILSGIIAGQKDLTVKRGLMLSFIYAQGMALTYSLLGLVVASMGSQFQAYLQHPSVLIATSVLFVFLAASMFGWINLQLPQSWTSRLTEVSNQQKSGKSLGVFLMGALSGLIASPCTTAPLTGALLYVAQTGDLVIGFVTLYVLSLGMGLPLLLIGASGGSLLPKAGNWMNVVKVIFGFILLAIPLILLERMIDFKWIVLMSGILSLLFAAYLHNQYLQVEKANVKAGFWLAKILFLTFGLLMLFKPFIGEVQPTQSFESSENAGHFVMVESVEEIEKEIANASAQNKVVMLDLYADWCVACKEFEKYTFSDPTVKSLMSRMVLLQVDMTDNDEQDIEILEKYQVLGLPTIMFFDRQGSERVSNRVTGFVGPEDFATHLNNLL